MKQKRYTLKGGVIAVIIDLLGVLFVKILSLFVGINFVFGLFSGLLLLPGELLLRVLVPNCFYLEDSVSSAYAFSCGTFFQESFFAILLSMIPYFIVGAIIGLIYEKKKNRRKVIFNK